MRKSAEHLVAGLVSQSHQAAKSAFSPWPLNHGHATKSAPWKLNHPTPKENLCEETVRCPAKFFSSVPGCLSGLHFPGSLAAHEAKWLYPSQRNEEMCHVHARVGKKDACLIYHFFPLCQLDPESQEPSEHDHSDKSQRDGRAKTSNTTLKKTPHPPNTGLRTRQKLSCICVWAIAFLILWVIVV